MRATLTAKEAAQEIGISVTQFRRAVDRGELPGPCLKSRPWRWSWVAIEKALANPDNDDAPLIDSKELLMERIRGLDPNEIR